MARGETRHCLTGTLPHEREGLVRYVSGAALAAVVLLAIALRLYRLNDQSLWFDDFAAFQPLCAPDLQSFLRLLRVEAPEQGAMPLYNSLQYCLGKWVGMNAEALRLLPVALDVSAVPLLYGFVRYLCGGRAALLAALCLALSPQHIWYAQALRPYALLTPLAVISAWTFMRGYRGGRPGWWAANLIANTLLAWTHLITVILILTEGFFLLAFSVRRFRRVVAWSAVQLLLLVPSALAVLGLAFTNHYIARDNLTLLRAVNLVLGGDLVRYYEEFVLGWKYHGSASAAFPSLIPLCPWFSLALLAVFMGVSAWAVVRLVRRVWRQRRKIDPTQDGAREVENMAFLLLLLFVPGLTVVLVSIKTVVCARYCMYNQAALYAIVGAALMALPHALLRRSAVLALLGLYTFQLLVLLPEVTRTNWKGAAAYIRNNAAPTDEVIDIQHWFPDRELQFYLSPDWPVRLVWTFQAACDDSARLLQSEPAAASDGTPKRVWIALQPIFIETVTAGHFDCAGALEQACQARGLKSTIKSFPGQFNVLVCTVERSGTGVRGIGSPVRQITPRSEIFAGAPLRPIDYDAVLDELGFQGFEQGQRSRLLAELRESVDHWPLDERFPVNSRICCVFPLLDMVSRGHCDLAEALARHLIDRHPDFGLLHMAMGMALLKEHKTSAARRAFAVAGKLHPDLGVVLAPFTDLLARNDDPDAVCKGVGSLGRGEFWFTTALRDMCHPELPSAGPVCAAP